MTGPFSPLNTSSFSRTSTRFFTVPDSSQNMPQLSAFSGICAAGLSGSFAGFVSTILFSLPVSVMVWPLPSNVPV